MEKTKKFKRYTEEQKQAILAAAKKGGLTGLQVSKKFGVSPLSFYRWRGPVRKPVAAVAKTNGHALNGVTNGLASMLRAEVRKLLPEIIKQEVSAVLGG